jgi:hypothetical protein
LNRSAVEEVEFDHSHIAGGISKIQTADNVIGIFTSSAMRERGQYQLQLLKTRSSNGVGSKVNLVFDVDSLKISDDTTGTAFDTTDTSTASMVDNLRKKTVVNKKQPDDEDTPVMDSGKNNATASLRAMLKTKTRSAFDEV